MNIRIKKRFKTPRYQSRRLLSRIFSEEKDTLMPHKKQLFLYKYIIIVKIE